MRRPGGWVSQKPRGRFWRPVTEGAARPARQEWLRPDIAAGSLLLRHVDCGSCNGCEVELSGCFGPTYDLESYGVGLTASPRHADGVLATGVVTLNMQGPLLAAIEAMCDPHVVVALGDCAIGATSLKTAYGVVGSVSDLVDVDLAISGCPPAPAEIVAALRRISKL